MVGGRGGDLIQVEAKRRAPVTGSDETARGIVEPGHDRGLATVFGQVTVNRMAYRHRGAANLYPADAVLNLPAEKYSHGLARLAAIEAPRGSFEQAGAAIARATGVRIGKRQVEQLAVAAAPAARCKLATRVSPGERNGRKRMAELGCVHDCEPVPRTAADIITRPGKSPPRPAPAKTAPAASGKTAERVGHR